VIVVVFAARMTFMSAWMSAVAFVMIAVMIAVVITVCPMTMIGFPAAASVISSTARAYKAMFAPAVTVAPASPGAHTKEDPVEEESRPVKAHGCAGVGRSFVVAVGADRRNADFHCDLCFRRRHQGQACE
jgi:hypothetical protein